jgi:DNA replication protein DnaC
MAELCPDCHGRQNYDREAPPLEDFDARARIPVRLRGIDFDVWQPAMGKPRAACETYVRTWPPSKPLMMLNGSKGTGKTTLAVAILRAARERHGVAGQFWPVIDLLDRYRACYDENATETVAQVDGMLAKMGLVILDDWGAHKGTDYAMERLFRLVDERYRDGKPLVITTNAGLTEMDGRVKSRLTDVRVATVVNFVGPDQRPVAP